MTLVIEFEQCTYTTYILNLTKFAQKPVKGFWKIEWLFSGEEAMIDL